MSLPLEIIDLIFSFCDIDTKLILRKCFPNFQFTQRKVQGTIIPTDLNILRTKSMIYNYLFRINEYRIVRGDNGDMFSSLP